MSSIEQLFDQVHKIPKVPEVVRTLITQLNDPKINMDLIAKNVEKEQVIAVKVLRIVNSAYFGLPRKVASINDAVIMLGIRQMKTLVIATGMVSLFPEIANFDIKSFWANNFRTACYAKWLAAEAGIDQDTAFTAGLINGLGSVLIYIGAPREAYEIEQQLKAGGSRHQIEERCLGYTSQDVCAQLCCLWNFPKDLITTIEQSGDPLWFENISSTACAVFVARYICECCESRFLEEDIIRSFPFEELEKLGLSEALIREKLPEILALESGLEGLLG